MVNLLYKRWSEKIVTIKKVIVIPILESTDPAVTGSLCPATEVAIPRATQSKISWIPAIATISFANLQCMIPSQ